MARRKRARDEFREAILRDARSLASGRAGAPVGRPLSDVSTDLGVVPRAISSPVPTRPEATTGRPQAAVSMDAGAILGGTRNLASGRVVPTGVPLSDVSTDVPIRAERGEGTALGRFLAGTVAGAGSRFLGTTESLAELGGRLGGDRGELAQRVREERRELARETTEPGLAAGAGRVIGEVGAAIPAFLPQQFFRAAGALSAGRPVEAGQEAFFGAAAPLTSALGLAGAAQALRGARALGLSAQAARRSGPIAARAISGLSTAAAPDIIRAAGRAGGSQEENLQPQSIEERILGGILGASVSPQVGATFGAQAIQDAIALRNLLRAAATRARVPTEPIPGVPRLRGAEAGGARLDALVDLLGGPEGVRRALERFRLSRQRLPGEAQPAQDLLKTGEPPPLEVTPSKVENVPPQLPGGRTTLPENVSPATTQAAGTSADVPVVPGPTVRAEPQAPAGQPPTQIQPHSREQATRDLSILSDFIEELVPERQRLQAQRSRALGRSAAVARSVMTREDISGTSAALQSFAAFKGTGFGDSAIQALNERLGPQETERLRNSLVDMVRRSPWAANKSRMGRQHDVTNVMRTIFGLLPTEGFQARFPSAGEVSKLREALGLGPVESKNQVVQVVEDLARQAGTNFDPAAVAAREARAAIRAAVARTGNFGRAIAEPEVGAAMERLFTVFSARVPTWAMPVRTQPTDIRSSQMERISTGRAREGIVTNPLSPEAEALAKRVEAAINRARQQSRLEKLIERAQSQPLQVPDRTAPTPVTTYIEEAALRRDIEAARNGDEEATARLLVAFPERTAGARAQSSIAEARKQARSFVNEYRSSPGKKVADAIRSSPAILREERVNRINELTARIEAGDRASDAASELTDLANEIQREREIQREKRVEAQEVQKPVMTESATEALSNAIRLVRQQQAVTRLEEGLGQIKEVETSPALRIIRGLASGLGIPRILRLTGDISTIANQGRQMGLRSLVLDATAPKRQARNNVYLRSAREAFQVYKDPARAAEIELRRQQDPDYDLFVAQAGLAQLQPGTSGGEEGWANARDSAVGRFLSKWIPLFSRSEVANTSFQNDFAFHYMKQLRDMYVTANDGRQPDLDTLRGFAKYINTSRGRAQLFEGDVRSSFLSPEFLSVFYLAPRWFVSQAIESPLRALLATPGIRHVAERIPGPVQEWMRDPVNRVANREMAKQLATILAIGTSLAALLPDNSVRQFIDPRSRRFLALRFGNLDVPILGPAGPFVRVFFQIASHSRLEEDGTVTDLSGRRMRAIWDGFSDAKKNSAIAAFTSYWFDNKINGEKVQSLPQGVRLFLESNTFLFLQTALEHYHNVRNAGLLDIAKGGLATVGSFVGLDVRLVNRPSPAGTVVPTSDVTSISGSIIPEQGRAEMVAPQFGIPGRFQEPATRDFISEAEASSGGVGTLPPQNGGTRDFIAEIGG